MAIFFKSNLLNFLVTILCIFKVIEQEIKLRLKKPTLIIFSALNFINLHYTLNKINITPHY